MIPRLILCASLALAGALFSVHTAPEAQAHPLLLGAPVPLNVVAVNGYYFDRVGQRHDHQCVLEVAADQPEQASRRYTEFVGAFRCSGPAGAITATYQAHLYDWPTGIRVASGPQYAGNTAHQGHSYGAYTRLHDQQSQQVELAITLSLPKTTGAVWNVPSGCNGVDTHTLTCALRSAPFQTVPLSGDCPATGCPDGDGDGVKDNVDACADQPGDPDWHGCPPPPDPPPDEPETGYEETGPAETEGPAPDDEESSADQVDTRSGGNYAVACPADDPYIETIAPTYAEDALGTAALNLTPDAALVDFLGSVGLAPSLSPAAFTKEVETLDSVIYAANSGSGIAALVVVERAPWGWIGAYYEGCSLYPAQLTAG